MKKIFLSIVIVSLSFGAFAQGIITRDTVFTELGRGVNNFDIKDTIKNTVNATLPHNWSISSSSILPTGFTIGSVCTEPYPSSTGGQCVAYNFTNHTVDSLPANGGIGYKTTVSIASNATLNSTAYVVINSDLTNGKKMVFAIKSIEFATSVKNVNTIQNISIYPSPATNILNIVHNSDKVSKAVIYNVIGKKMGAYNTPFGENGFSVPVTDLSDGIYFIELQDKNSAKLALRKFVKN